VEENHTPRRVIALGFFDGVHNGHAALLRQVARRAEELSAVPAAVTFDTHPENLILKQPVPLLTSPADREELMGRLFGIRDVIVAHFDQRMMHMPWEEFVTDYLVREQGAVHLVAGHDFHFGYKGEGDPERLAAKCAQLGIGCDIIPPVCQEGRVVSSTYIRTLIAQGEMELAGAFLGHPHSLTDTVSHGKRLGSALGFPTVNLRIPAGVIVPAFGVYATRVFLEDGRAFAAATNVGLRPTVGDGSGGVTVEGFLLDFDGDLYGQRVRMEFYKFLRPEEKFPSLDALRGAVMENARQTREYFALRGA
jgi:riboflavin kinase/FMN adenylyltransferase